MDVALIRRSLASVLLTLLAASCATQGASRDSRSSDETRLAAESTQRPSRPRTSDRCYTPAANCLLSERRVVGSSCWCVTPFGPSYGEVK